jgi:hypothetical protein
VPFIAKPLQGSEARDGQSSRVVEADAFRFPDELVFGSTCVFGKSPLANAEHAIARRELRCPSSDRCDLTSDIDSGPLALHAPVQRIDGSGANPYDNFVLLRNRLFEVLYFEDLSQFGLGVDGAFHVG